MSIETVIDEKKIFEKVDSPTLIQMEVSECGAAALGIVFGYYQAFIPLEQLRVECGVTRDGSNAYYLVQTARKYGFECHAIMFEDKIAELKHIRTPFIVYWDFNHFLVVEGVGDKSVYLNDPSIGKRTVSIDEFNQSFTGVVIALYPNEHFKKVKKQRHMLNFVKTEVSEKKSTYFFLALSSLFLIVLGILTPGFSKIFIDDVLIANHGEWFAYLILGMVLTAIIRNILSFLQQRTLLKYKISFLTENSKKLLWHLFHLPITFFQQRYIGDVCYRSQAFQRIGESLTNNISSSVINLISVIFFISIIFTVSFFIGLILLGGIYLIYLIYKHTKSKIASYSIQYLQLSGALNGVQLNGIQSIEMLKATSTQEAFYIKWTSLQARMIALQQKLYSINQYSSILMNTIVGLINVLVLSYGAWLIINGELTVGTLVAMQTLVMSTFDPVMILFSFSQELEKLKADFVRVYDILLCPKEDFSESECANKANNDESGVNVLVFKDIFFRYSQYDPFVLSNVSLNVFAGKKVSVVGASGSGKSTLAKIAVRLLIPESGLVFLNKIPHNSIDSAKFKTLIGYIDQEVLLFEGTMRSNITFYDESISDEAILLALKEACLFDFVNENGGLEYFIEEGGKNLSYGQKQRVELARALLFQPKILVMDEATSYLDLTTENLIMANLKNKGCGLLVITHRLSAVQDSDQIMVLNQGVVSEIGTHEHLLANNPIYSSLYQND